MGMQMCLNAMLLERESKGLKKMSRVGLALLVIITAVQVAAQDDSLRVGFYSQTCPQAEAVVNNVVLEATRTQPRTPSILLRLQFHDCFVQGCDGSILIEGADSEMNAPANGGVMGFQEVKTAKATLEQQCPGVVSCADIVVMAARDAIFRSGGPFYEVETGRRDGRVPNAEMAQAELPDALDSIDTLINKFKIKGLTERDLVVLSAAHTIGTVACFFLKPRLYEYGGVTGLTDPAIHPTLVPLLKAQCGEQANGLARINMDWFTNTTFDDQILRNINTGFAVLASDARLKDNAITQEVIDLFVGPEAQANSSFSDEFARAMVKLGRLGVKTGIEGEIRPLCEVVIPISGASRGEVVSVWAVIFFLHFFIMVLVIR